MKNKHLRTIVLCVVMTVFSVILVGCTKDYYNTNITFEGKAMLYETASSKALPSCALVSVMDKRTGVSYNTVGVFVSNSGYMIVDASILPAKKQDNNLVFQDSSLFVKVWQKDNTYIEYSSRNIVDNKPQVSFIGTLKKSDDHKDIGLAVIKVEGEFVAIEFADSSSLDLGDNLLAIDYFSIGDSQALRVFEGIVGNTNFLPWSKEHSATYFSTFMMTLSGGFNPNRVLPPVSLTFDKIVDSRSFDNMKSSSAVVIDTNGKIVGFNRLKLINNQNSNEHIVHGISYAIKGNAIRQALDFIGIEV